MREDGDGTGTSAPQSPPLALSELLTYELPVRVSLAVLLLFIYCVGRIC